MEDNKRELGIYIHIPFCKRKCYYCDFTSFAGCDELHERYINCIKSELEFKLKKLNNSYVITTIYIGGGTPSFIDSKYIKEIVQKIKNNNLRVENEIEVTIEANPGTVTKEKLIDYKESGINRLSIGLQSTKNKLLKKIGRIHTYEQFVETYNLAREVGFDSINVDLMLGLPNQTIQDLKESINNILKLEPEHISVYSLILEEDTILYEKVNEGKIVLPDEELERQMYWYVKNTLELNGYKHYEISNFAKEGYESKHNINCWKQKEYLGLGVAASSYLDGERSSNVNVLNEYIKNIEAEKYEKNQIIEEVQTVEEMQKEFMMLGLRMIDGVSIQEFKLKFGENPIYEFRNKLDELTKDKLIIVDGDRIKLTNKGIDLANLVWKEFI